MSTSKRLLPAISASRRVPAAREAVADNPRNPCRVPDANTVIYAHHLSVRIGDDYLLAPVSFTVRDGETMAIVGPNGSGKMTLLRVIAGLLPASTGVIEVAGAEPDERSPAFRRRLAAAIGIPPMAHNVTLCEYLALIGISWGRTLQEANDEACQLLDELGIARLAKRFPHELSSGQTQLFSLAVTLVRPCSVLLLDEPEQRLDPDRLALVSHALMQRKANGTTLVVASHSATLVHQLADARCALGEGGAGVPR